jgi:hypothetical protein
VVRRTAIPAVLAALALFASAACSSSGAEKGSAGANPTVATDPPRTNTTVASLTTTTNPYAVPAVIDAAYVNRVLAGLDAVLGDVARTVAGTRTIPPDAYARLRAIYGTDQLLQLTIDSVQADIRRGFAGYRSPPGNRVSTVQQILSASPTCIFVRVQRDYRTVSTNPPPLDPQWVGVRTADPARDPGQHNPTSWTMIYDGLPQDRSTPANPCVA